MAGWLSLRQNPCNRSPGGDPWKCFITALKRINHRSSLCAGFLKSPSIPPRLARMLCFEAVDRVGVVLRLRICFFFLHFPPPRTLPPLPPRRCGESGFIIELALSWWRLLLSVHKKTRTFLVHCIVAAWGGRWGNATTHPPPLHVKCLRHLKKNKTQQQKNSCDCANWWALLSLQCVLMAIRTFFLFCLFSVSFQSVSQCRESLSPVSLPGSS